MIVMRCVGGDPILCGPGHLAVQRVRRGSRCRSEKA